MTHKICPNCGNDIEADDPHGLCPTCLLKQGLTSETADPSLVQGGPVERDPLRTALEAKLQGQYRLIRLLGHGGMGAVYLARDLTLDREVAIKVVKTASEGRDMYERFRREARTAAKLSHPNIVPLHAFGEVEGMPYFVMGYVRGESLADRLRRDGKLPEEEARRIFAEIADALDHAHRQGVIHRDIKPDNVLLEDESGRALLTDFGVAKAVGKGETLTRLGNVVGTPHYMSPEQASGRADIDGRSDIYSLGVMAYAMLAGRLPFEGSTPADVLTKHLTQEPAPLRSVAPTVSDSTVEAVERCLAKDPAARWPDARSLKLALGVTEESALPDALRGVEGKGVTAAGITLTLMLIYVLMTGHQERWVLWLIETSVAAIFVIAYAFVVTRLHRDGFSLSQSQSAIWREPAWWLWWYPRALRRRGNVWHRLPAAVRYLRWSIHAFVAYVLFAYVVIILLRDDAGRIIGFRYTRGPTIPFIVTMGTFTAIVLSWAIFTVRARRDLRGKGLAPYDVNRVMMSVPPSRVSFWARPHIAAILAPATRPETTRRSESPHDYLQSILHHADELSGPLRPLGAQAAVAARQLVASIDHADRQIADLARNIEPGEEERLADKIEALAAPATGEDEFAPMRTLLEKQLELIRGLSARIEEARDRRTRRVEMLRTLALHVASLRARLTDTPSEVRQISDNVRALCDDIGRQTMALDPMVAAGGGEAMPTVERRST
jgi:hypothetical protein